MPDGPRPARLLIQRTPCQIDADELFDYLKFLGYKCKKVDVKDIIWEVDEDCDGCVSWAEFQTM